MAISRMEENIAQEITKRIYDRVSYSEYDSQTNLRWNDLYSFPPSDVVKFRVTELLNDLHIESVLMGNFIVCVNKIVQKLIKRDPQEDKAKMYKICKRIYDIIRHRVGRDSMWFTLGWGDMLDNGEHIPPVFINYIVSGLNNNGIDAWAEEDCLHICADNSTLNNPFFKQEMGNVTPRENKYLLTSGAD